MQDKVIVITGASSGSAKPSRPCANALHGGPDSRVFDPEPRAGACTAIRGARAAHLPISHSPLPQMGVVDQNPAGPRSLIVRDQPGPRRLSLSTRSVTS
jgi:hypothetical protein